jgi:hypothetical protein
MASQVSIDDDRPASYEDACRMLIRAHTENEPALEQIYLVPDPERQEVRLIEINPETAPTGELMLFELGRTPDFPFRSVIGEVTASEWESIRVGALPLPAGWALPPEPVWRREAA